MPGNKLKRNRRKRQYRKKYSNVNKSLKKKLDKLAKDYYSTVELKKNDVREAPRQIQATSWELFDLSDIDAGTGSRDDERVGSKVTISSIQTHMAFNKIQGDDFIRILICQFDDLDGSQVSADTVHSVLEYGNPANNIASGLEMDPILSPYKMASDIKYKVLYDKVLSPIDRKQISVAEQVAPIIARRVLYINSGQFRSFKKVLTFLSGQNQVKPETNGIYMFIYSTSTRLTSVDGASTVYVQTRMKYRDA